jgi:aspartyl-tRNA synthetase
LARFIDDLKRTHHCNALSAQDVGAEVVLMGWAHRRRDHGGLIFVDLRDREGITQVVFNPQIDEHAHQVGHLIRSEYCLAVKGKVELRPEDMINPKLATGEIEVYVTEFEILGAAENPPFQLEVEEERSEVSEAIRLTHRYLDLRQPWVAKNFRLRHQCASFIRRFLDHEGFIEVETPVLTRSTPEGARDYLVPSRVNQGKFYALPQSPQLFKQLLMVAGFEKYYQIVKCFRDEDLRADRQPEFTQVDLELSFINEEDIYDLLERMMVGLFQTAIGVELTRPFPRLTYDEAVGRYGLDAPDVRFGLELREVTDLVREAELRVFAEVAAAGGLVKSLNCPGGAELSRKELDDLTQFAGVYGAKGLAWVKVKDDGAWQSPIAKFFTDGQKEAVTGRLAAAPGDIFFFVADQPAVVHEALGRLRLRLADRFGLVEAGRHSLVWVTEFPLLEYNPDEKRWQATHHPFTSPRPEDLDFLAGEPGRVKARAYDLVYNGVEIGGGSVRIHRPEVQQRVFAALGIGPEEAERKFGFLLEALKFGAPPHAGLALGFDRLTALLAGRSSIRDMIAFPKTQKAVCPLTQAPADIDPGQWLELGLRRDV